MLIQAQSKKIKELQVHQESVEQEKEQLCISDQKNNALKTDLNRKDDLLNYWKSKYEELNAKLVDKSGQFQSLQEQKDSIHRQLRTQNHLRTKLEAQVQELKIFEAKMEQVKDALLEFFRLNFKRNNLESTTNNTLYQRMQSISTSYLGLDLNLLYQDTNLEDQLKQIFDSKELKTDLTRFLSKIQ